MSIISVNLYAQWRLRSGVANELRDDNNSPPEHLLQAIWQHQRLRRDQLKTLDGKSVRVLHPGFGNVEGGPDFRGAVLQIGDAAPRSGDVEVDIRASGWHAHGHDRNPAFQNVILHVVWDAVGVHAIPCQQKVAPDNPARGGIEIQSPPATLSLRPVLDAPLAELSLWLEREPAKSLPENLRGKCTAPLRELSEESRTELLCQAAKVRFEAKAAQFQARARHAGWEQALWEGLFRALGYKRNVWPMHCLAERRERWARGNLRPLILQARLLGLSGLLPAELGRAQSGGETYLRSIWDTWWRERDAFEDCTLPRCVWKFHGLRPANHPLRRLALAAHWLAKGDLPAKLESWCTEKLPDKEFPDSLLKILQIERDDFWSWHLTFRSPRLKKPQPLLGGTRVTDVAVNVILPWLWTRAAEGKNSTLQKEIERRFFTWPPAEDNAMLRLARQRLLGGAMRRPKNAAVQQGLMQIVRDFCDHTNAICDNCQFPQLVKAWPR